MVLKMATKLDSIQITTNDLQFIAKSLKRVVPKQELVTFVYIPRRGYQIKKLLDPLLGNPSWYTVELGDRIGELAELEWGSLPRRVGNLVFVDDITQSGISLASCYFNGCMLSGVRKIIGVVGKDYASAAHIAPHSSRKYKTPTEYLQKEKPQTYQILNRNDLLHHLDLPSYGLMRPIKVLRLPEERLQIVSVSD